MSILNLAKEIHSLGSLSCHFKHASWGEIFNVLHRHEAPAGSFLLLCRPDPSSTPEGEAAEASPPLGMDAGFAISVSVPLLIPTVTLGKSLSPPWASVSTSGELR